MNAGHLQGVLCKGYDRQEQEEDKRDTQAELHKTMGGHRRHGGQTGGSQAVEEYVLSTTEELLHPPEPKQNRRQYPSEADEACFGQPFQILVMSMCHRKWKGGDLMDRKLCGKRSQAYAKEGTIPDHSVSRLPDLQTPSDTSDALNSLKRQHVLIDPYPSQSQDHGQNNETDRDFKKGAVADRLSFPEKHPAYTCRSREAAGS